MKGPICDFVCSNRRYRASKFLSPIRLCGNCSYEIGDLFTGTKGLTLYSYYCNVEREEDKKTTPV